MPGVIFWPLLIVGVFLLFSARRVPESKRLVVFSLGQAKNVIGPGLVFVWPFFQLAKQIDVAPRSLPLPTVTINDDDQQTLVPGTYSYLVHDPMKAVTATFDAHDATAQLVATVVKTVLSQCTVRESLRDLRSVERRCVDLVNKSASTWGVTVIEITLRDLKLPVQLLRLVAHLPSQLAARLSADVGALPGASSKASDLEEAGGDETLESLSLTDYKFGI